MQTNQPRNTYFDLKPDRSDFAEDQRSLERLLRAALAYIPVLLTFNALGVVVIYVLGRFGLLEQSDNRLLLVAGQSIFVSLLHIPLFALLHQRHLNLAAILILIFDGLGAASQVLFWQGMVWFPLMMVASIGLVFAFQKGLGLRYRWISFFVCAAMAVVVLYLDGALPYARMNVASNLSLMAALALYFFLVLAMVILVLINSVIDFHAIASRLVTTFTFIAFLSAGVILTTSALANLYSDRQRVLEELEATANSKGAQILTYLSNLEQDTRLYLSDPLIDQRITYLLTNEPDAPLYRVNRDLVRAYLVRQEAQSGSYQEFLLVDATGTAIISTTAANQDRRFSTFDFFQNTLIGINSAIEYDFPSSTETTSVLVTRPILQNGNFRGGIVARVGFDSIKRIMATKTGIGDTAETYLVGLVNNQVTPLTATRMTAPQIDTLATQETLTRRIDQGSGIYDNYLGTTVLGSYLRISTLKIAVLAEIEQQEITQKTLRILITNVIIGIFTILLAFLIVLITSRSISMPLVGLAQKANSLASGELTARMEVDRQDEIGTLANSFNSMAEELQSLVKNLEQKVDDRTQDLQKQANYLRLASEVARDSTNARNLSVLLNQGAQVILDRFGFYHTGIFLLDQHGEYAILRASPTEPGQEMLARGHKLKVGQEGIVGYVAATGSPRIALDTGQDAIHFNNPLLPMTRSEMALPLKVNEQLLGVLDVQSEQPDAFTQDDIAILQIMADQLALAIVRVRLAEEQERSLLELETTSRQFTLTNWQNLVRETEFKPGYKFDGMQITPLETFSKESQAVLRQGRSLVIPPAKGSENSGARLVAPLKLRDQVIGALAIQFNVEAISSETVSLIEETANRLAIALDNARLYSETQKFAERERAVSEITARITSSVNLENILRTFVQELGNRLPDAEVTVQLQKSQQ